MKRLSRHTVAVLLVLLLSCLGGMTVAVVAFGQSGGDPGATVPLSDYTTTTPPASTTPLSSYTTPTPTTTTTVTPTTTTPTTTGQSSPAGPSTPTRTQGAATIPAGTVPSRVTRSGPTSLAFTGGEPIVVGAFGLVLTAAGLLLHRRRRAARGR
ncbi:MAG TPA: hypothetical protein VNT03_16525 [Baekduia sp.]|nr:hypothetical protein [Baekduia sp.]